MCIESTFPHLSRKIKQGERTSKCLIVGGISGRASGWRAQPYFLGGDAPCYLCWPPFSQPSRESFRTSRFDTSDKKGSLAKLLSVLEALRDRMGNTTLH